MLALVKKIAVNFMKKYHSFFTDASAPQNADVLFIESLEEKRASGCARPT